MASIDQRIVELKFNGKQFQSGIQAAIASLDNLKKNLNMNKAASEFDKVEKASKKVTFNDLYTSVDSISNRFSTFGIVAMSALNQITTTAMQTGKRLLSALTSPLIEGGKRRALNIEQAKFQIQGLGYTWESVEEDINYGVKDTAYGLDAAAKAASQLLASQVKVGDEMKASLRGISGVAAMTSSEYEDIANVFTTVAGNGRLMGDQLMQLSSRGLNAAATLGQYLGKSEKEVREMTSKGEIDFKTFAAAMDFAFGEHAKKANETFSGSLSNMKAALSRIGANFATPAYQNLRDIFNSLTPVIDGVNKALAPLVDTAKDGMKYITNFITKTLGALGKEGTISALSAPMEKLNRILKAFGTLVTSIAKIINSIVNPVFSAFAEVMGLTILDSFAGAVEIIAKFASSMVFTNRMVTNLKKTFVAIFTIVNTVFKAITSVIAVVSDVLFSVFSATFGFIADIILAVTGHVGDLIVKIHNFIFELFNLKTVQGLLSTISNIFITLRSIITRVYYAIRELSGVIIDKTFTSAIWIFDKIASAILFIVKFVDMAVQKVIELINRLRELPVVQNFVSNMSGGFDELRSSIRKAASTLKSKFISSITRARQVISKFAAAFKDLIGQYVKIPTLQEVIAGIQEFVSNLFESAVNIFNKTKDALVGIFNRIAELNSVSLKGIIENFGRLKDKIVQVIDISGKLKFITEIFGGVKDGASAAAQGTISTLDLIKKKLSEFFEYIKTKFNDLTMGDVVAAGIGGTFIVFLIQLTKFIQTADKLTSTLQKSVDFVSKIQKSVTGAIDSFKELNKAKAQTLKMDAIANLIKSVVALAAAVALLATMDPERVRESAAVLLILSGGLIALSSAMNSISANTSPDVIAKTALQLVAAAGSMVLLSLSLKILSDIPVGNIITALISIAALMAELIAFMVVMNKFSPEVAEGTINILAFAGSLLLLSRALSLIGSMSAKSIVSSMAVISILMVSLGVMVKLADKATMSKKAAVGILAIIISLRLLVGAMKSLASMDANTIRTGLLRMMELMGTLSLLLISTRFAGEHAAKAGASIVLMAIAMNIMVQAVKGMASIDNGMLKQASNAINETLKIFALITLMTKFAGPEAVKAGAAIMMMSGSMVIIAGAMVLLSRLSEDELKRATVSVTTIMGMFAILVAATGLMKPAAKTMKLMAITLGILLGGIAVLALIQPENLLSASIAISMVMGMFALLVASTSLATKAGSTILSMLAVIVVLAIVLKNLADLQVENTLSVAASLSSLLLSMSISALILSKIGPVASAGVGGAAAFLGLVVAFGAVLGVLGGLIALIPGAEEFLSSGIPIIQKLGEAIGNFIGGIVGGIAAGASESLVKLANNLSMFMEALQPFLNMVSDIDDRAISGCIKIVEMIALFAVSDFINGLSSWNLGKSSIESMAQQLPLLGKGMQEFAKSLDGVDLDSLMSGTQAVKSLAEISTIVSEGGLADGIFGSSNEGMKKFSKNLPALGEALTSYGESVKGLNTEDIKNSVEPAKSLMEISNIINGEGGLLQLLGGSSAKGFKSFGENLTSLGDGLAAYSKSISGKVDYNAVNRSTNPVKALVEIANLISAEDGFLNDVIGSKAQGLADFADNLKDLGESLSEYSRSVSGRDLNAVRQSVDPLKALVEIANLIENEGGVSQAFEGSGALGLVSFAVNLVNLGIGISQFSKSITDNGGIDSNAISSAASAIKILAEASSYIAPEGGFSKFLSGSGALGTALFGSNLPLLGQGLSDFSKASSEIDSSSVAEAANALNHLAFIAVLIGREGGTLQDFLGSKIEGLSNFSENLTSLGDGLVEFSNRANQIGDISGIQNAISVVQALAEIYNSLNPSGGAAGFWLGDQKDALQSLIDNISNLSSAFENAGSICTPEILSGVLRLVSSASSINSVAQNVTELGDLEDAGQNIENFSNHFKTFAENLDGLNYDAVNTGLEYFGKLKEATANWVDFPDISSSLNTFVQTLSLAAGNAVQRFIDSLNAGNEPAANAAVAMVGYAITQACGRIEQGYEDFQIRGKELVVRFSNGMRSGGSDVQNAMNFVLNSAVASITNYYSNCYSSGQWLMTGLANGIRDNGGNPGNAAYEVGRNVVNKLRESMQVNSPSKEGIEVGKFLDMGLQVGIVKYASMAIAAANELGEDVVNEMNSFKNFDLLDDMDLNPIITPTVDTSELDRRIKQINSDFSSAGSIPINMQGMYLSSSFGKMSRRDLDNMEIQNGSVPQVINNYDMTQNNYSPKALSQFDIYRQTRNQFSRLKGVVNK